MRLGSDLEPSWGRLGAILGPSWALLGPSWGLLGLPGGGSQSGLGRMLERFEVKVPFECDLEATWSRLGAVLGPAWGHLGSSRGRLGASLGALGAILVLRLGQYTSLST